LVSGRYELTGDLVDVEHRIAAARATQFAVRPINGVCWPYEHDRALEGARSFDEHELVLARLDVAHAQDEVVEAIAHDEITRCGFGEVVRDAVRHYRERRLDAGRHSGQHPNLVQATHRDMVGDGEHLGGRCKVARRDLIRGPA